MDIWECGDLKFGNLEITKTGNLVKLARGWRAVGARLARIWRAVGAHLARGWRAVGARLARGWRAAGSREIVKDRIEKRILSPSEECPPQILETCIHVSICPDTAHPKKRKWKEVRRRGLASAWVLAGAGVPV